MFTETIATYTHDLVGYPLDNIHAFIIYYISIVCSHYSHHLILKFVCKQWTAFRILLHGMPRGQSYVYYIGFHAIH